ncbi:MAG TPA: DUF4124 domain-containing protein [Gammaproteobacteria bacterium]|nr:DUF4124 domain-containing protein [Gammaproteobacteria bacterium]
MTERLIIILVCLFALTAVQARMYQWQDPNSGTTHLSGNPPPWYRTGEGPRVIVFEKGRVVDDTRIELSAEANSRLRLEAIARAEESREKARQKALAAEEMKAKLDSEKEPPAMDQPVEPAPMPEELTLADEKKDTGLTSGQSADDLQEEQMRALIQEWERRQGEQGGQ